MIDFGFSDPLQAIKRKQAWKQGMDFSGKALIEGACKGEMHAKAVMVGPTGRLLGNIYAEQVVIGGEVSGTICARKVHVQATARVRGLIIAQVLEIEAGAHFEGKCRSLTRLLELSHRQTAQMQTLKLAAE